DTGDITVTGPAGPLAVTGVSLDTNGDGTPRTATYTVAAPGGSWDLADSGAYTVALLTDEVFDTNGNAVAADTNLTGFTVDIADVTAPVVQSASAPTIDAADTGNPDTQVTVTFTDNIAVDASSIDTGDIAVTGPAGPLAVTGVSLDTNSDGTPRTATYTVAAPGGSWDLADSGAYTVALLTDEVFDTG
ncbi:hypothetical protein, partial [Ruegeria sp. SCP11]|uniref:hypothetical protein n=1 Tax=Ruegeria sp. SCP11 TaxID=3141378 RepID=UPI00333D8C70